MGNSAKAVGDFLVRLFGSRNERVVKSMLGTVEEINRLEPAMQKLPDKALSAKTEEFRNRLFDGLKGRDFTREEADRELNKLLPEAFAVVREASRRVVLTPDARNPQLMRHFDVQLIGGIVLHEGAIAEMVTGEGKTLAATLAVYVNALPGRGVHIVTVNDYLAQRDRDWMSPLYELLGLTAGAIQNRQDYEDKRAAYRCDVTFGKDSEFGFDYLRDNMRWTVEEQVQLGRLYYAIVDEVDSVLIDEARTPLIISGPSEESTDKYYKADKVARRLGAVEHFEVKEKDKSVRLLEGGIATAEKFLGVDNIYAAGRTAEWPHHIEQALRAHHLYRRDVEYVVKQGEIIIVDEFTGRLMPGRRWSDGLHQAIEAKEGLRIKEEDQTLATVTYQNFFRLYKKLAGMTGTALTEATEFAKIYKLDVVSIPTNKPLIRAECGDVVYRTEKEKFDALEEEIVEQNATGRPLLVGTISIEKSERLSERLKRRGIKHEVLNAKHHEREAQIVAQAGQMGHVTIATNMAGRGVDIMLGRFTQEELMEHWARHGLAPEDFLGGDLSREGLERRLTEHWAQYFLDEATLKRTPREEWGEALEAHWKRNRIAPLRVCGSVAALGGLHIVGTERHEARRIDNQLRGRAGRQGDPGSSRFFLSLEDDLMRIFASDRVSSLLKRIGMEEGMAIEHGMVTRSIQNAQKKVEEHNFEIRKHLLEYDEVMDEQRKAVYGLRQQVVEKGEVKQVILAMMEDCLYDELDALIPDDSAPEDRNGRTFCEWARRCGAAVETGEWRSRDLAGVRALFRERKAGEWGDGAGERVVRDCVENAMGLLMEAEKPFFRWDLTEMSRWARRNGLAAEAEAMRKRFFDRLLALVEKAARDQQAGTDAAIEVLVEQGVDTYLTGAVAMEEWDLGGLVAWAEAAGFTLPVSQWQRAGEEEEVEGDRLSAQVDTVREQLTQRLRRALRNRDPADVIARVACHETGRLVKEAAEDERRGLGRVVSSLDKLLGVSVPLSDAEEAIREEREGIAASLARQLKDKLADRSGEERIAFCTENMVDTFLALDLADAQRNLAGLCESMHRKYGLRLDAFDLSKLSPAEMGQDLLKRIGAAYEARAAEVGPERMRAIERYLLLQKIDTKWKDHLLAMDHLKGGIGLRGYAQVDPKVEYTREARLLFDQMQASVRMEVTDLILRLEMRGEEEEGGEEIWAGGTAKHGSEAGAVAAAQAAAEGIRRQQASAIAGTERPPEPIRAARRVGRNDPCPCGSGKKFKKCCGRAA